MRRSLTLATLALLAAAAPAPAKTLLTTTVTAAKEKERTCHSRLLSPGRAHAQRTVTTTTRGALRATLNAKRGDWDVAIFDARTRAAIAGSAGFGATEIAEGLAPRAGRYVVQACRRDSGDRTAKLTVTFSPQAAPGSKEKVQLLNVSTPTPAAKTRLQALDVDLSEHGDDTHLEVVTYSDAERAKLAANGFTWTVEVPDLVASDKAARRADARAAAEETPSELPSGRTSYRTLADYEADLKLLVERYPGMVRPITLPNTTLEGRPVQGVEIASNVNASDGRPVFLQMGVHHAREWPSSEHAIEWAFELTSRYGKSARTTKLVDSVRTIVIPIVNADGFNLSRSGLKDNKRKNCRMTDGQIPAPGACAAASGTSGSGPGVDPNRNYGGLWGGPGQSRSASAETYSGGGPFSEPETQNIKALVSSRQVVGFITNHTQGGLLLRPPGVRAQGPPKDEVVYKALGDAMAGHNGYASQKSYQLYDTTGTAEDWSYFATGGFGFTFEIGAGSFHYAHASHVVDEWLGRGTTKGAGKGGNREAYYTIMSHVANPAYHAVIGGRAPTGSVLRVRKSFKTETSPVTAGLTYDPLGNPLRFDDKLESSMVVPTGGQYLWHLNPSTRPLIAGRKPVGPTSSDFEYTDAPPLTVPRGNSNVPLAPIHYDDRQFTVTKGEDNGYIEATVFSTQANQNQPTDFDLVLFQKEADGTLTELKSTAVRSNSSESVRTLHAGPGTYVVRVVNNQAVGDFRVLVDFLPPDPPEAWTLTCENPDGKVLGERKLVVDRGDTLTINPCR